MSTQWTTNRLSASYAASCALSRLRRAHVDVAIDCELFSRISSLLSYASGARIRVGFHRHTQEGLYRGSHINRPVPYNPYQHISAQFLTLVRAIDSAMTPPSNCPPIWRFTALANHHRRYRYHLH